MTELDRARAWSADLAATLDEITAHVGAAARALADGWPDVHGQDWVDRLHRLGHGLDRDADAVADFGRSVDRVAADTTGTGPDPGYGPYLGGTGGRRVDERRGATIPQLNDPADGVGGA